MTRRATTLHLARPEDSRRRQNMARIRQAVKLFRSPYAPRSVRRHNARMWLRSITLLGSKWRLAEPIRLQRQV